MGMKCVYNMAT